MSWKVDSTQPIDEVLKERMKDKIEDGSFAVEDLQDYFTLFTQMANHTDDVQDEVDGFDRKFQFTLEGHDNVWLTIKDQKFEMGLGDIEAPDITLEMKARVTAGVFTGQEDATAAYMSGDLKVSGILSDAIKFRTIVDLVREALD